MRVVYVILHVATITKAGLENVTQDDNLLTKSMRNYLKEKYNGTKIKICYNDFLKKMAKFQKVEKNNEWQPYLPYGVHIQLQASTDCRDCRDNLEAAEDLKKIFNETIDEKVKKALEKCKPKALGVGCGAHVSNNLPTCCMHLCVKANNSSIEI